MIQASELRIGNAIEGGLVTHLKPNLIVLDNKKSIRPEFANPIPLTTEILESCGFESEDHKWLDGSMSSDYYWKRKYNIGYNVFDSERHYFLGRSTNENNSEFLANFKYLHHLQNLYFALTGEELNVKLPKEENA